MDQEIKNCKQCKKDFVIEPDDFGFYEKMKVPPPVFCPECRQQQRILHRNFKTLYKRPSSKSGEMIISMYNPDVPFPVYDISEWWGDDWEASSYAMDLDLSIPFVKQMDELFKKVPHFSLMNTKSTNCEYSNMTLRSNNCYLIFGCIDDENCDYGHIVWSSTDCTDNLYVYKCELCYECMDCIGSNRLIYSEECEACVDSIGLFDCRGCTNCIGCVGLRQQSHKIFNQPVTKEEYQEFLRNYPLNKKESIEYILEKREELRKKIPTRAVYGSHNTNVSGDHIYNAHNVHYSFDIKGGENSKFCFTAKENNEVYDGSFTIENEFSYQILTCANSHNVFFSHLLTDCNEGYYSQFCFNSKNIFGCMGLRNKQYCILNKQYTKEEYEKLMPQIIENMKKTGDWGNFFPIWMSPFAYNESITNEYMPLTKKQALDQGFSWRDDIPSTTGKENCAYEDLPKDPKEYSDEKLLDKILKCESCGKNYRFISREIGFYKRMGLALPSKCSNCRHQRRMDTRNKRELNDSTCASCGIEIETTFSKEKQEVYKIYCEKCYQREIY
ncbi:MAG: zinc-ribbon domain containing protein [Candidatus Nomurabacteria bacterium]|nr:zinc-ribbon domain containing protein [Candidatus Nomurabacteria bacterium]